MSLAFFRDATWLTRRRIRNYASMIIAATVAILAWLLMGNGSTDPLGRPIGTDFVSFWTVSWALINDHVPAIYAPEALAALERMVEGGNHAFYAWLYPPIALLIVYPLAFLPYFWSLTIWLAAGLIGYLTALWRIVPRPLALWAGLAFPAVPITLEHGQNALLTTSLLAWALLLLSQRPIVAGILIGLLTFKPQLGLLVPIALIASGHWRVIMAAATTGMALAIATVVLFGADIWSEYFAITPLARDVLDLGLVPHYKMQSVYAAVRLLGGAPIAAYALQAFAALCAAVFVAWAWQRPADQGVKNSALLAAIPLATPFMLDYDLLLLAPAIAWLARRGVDHRALPWERITLVAVCIDPLIARVVGQYTQILLTPAVVAALLILIARRIHAETQHEAQGSARDCKTALPPIGTY